MAPALSNSIDHWTKLRRYSTRLFIARRRFFAHNDPGNLTPAEKRAYELEHSALALMLEAAQTLYDAEMELQALLDAEACS